MDNTEAYLNSIVLQSDADGVRTYKVEFTADGTRYGMTVEADEEGLNMQPDAALEPCLDTFGSLDDDALDDADEETLHRWAIGELADEIMGTLAESGLLSGWSMGEGEDEEWDEDDAEVND